MARLNAEDYIDINITNDKELQKLFTELKPAVQNKIVLAGMRSSATIILGQAKSNFKSNQKNKSKTGYKNFNKSFTTEPMSSNFGLRVGIKNYKYKWIEFGTEDRWLSSKTNKKKHFVGKIQPTHFFFDAVTSKKTEALNKVSTAIIDSLEKTVKKYNATNK